MKELLGDKLIGYRWTEADRVLELAFKSGITLKIEADQDAHEYLYLKHDVILPISTQSGWAILNEREV